MINDGYRSGKSGEKKRNTRGGGCTIFRGVPPVRFRVGGVCCSQPVGYEHRSPVITLRCEHFLISADSQIAYHCLVKFSEIDVNHDARYSAEKIKKTDFGLY